MADKKITIKPSDMERLRELMRQEEEKLDAANPSDAELAVMESELEDSIRRLAKKIPGSMPSHDSEMDRNWQALQQKMTVTKTSNPADVLPLTRKPKNKALPWIGLAAAAALVMIMVRPGSQPGDATMNESQVVMKGNTESTTRADCQVDVGSLDGTPVTPTENGLGFVGKAGAKVEVTVKCDSAGVMRADIQGAKTIATSTPITPGERQRILREVKIAEISLQSSRPSVISLILVDKDEQILWQDKITVGASE